MGLELIKRWEKFMPVPYKDTGGVPTIGYGTTYYPDGRRVTMNDHSINEQEATVLLLTNLEFYERGVDSITRDDITQTQFDALVSFAYNVGIEPLKRSKLLRIVNKNPHSPLIAREFRRWRFDNGKELRGLLNRRNDEIRLYFYEKRPEVVTEII
jgi:lysozyme